MTAPQPIDAAVHIWADDHVAYPWSPHDGHELPEVTGGHELLLDTLDANGVAGAVCVQPRVLGYDHGYLLHAIGEVPERLAGVALVNPVRPAGPDELRRLVELGVRGLRLIPLASAQPSWLTGRAGDPLWAAAANLGIPVAILCSPAQLPLVHDRARRADTPVVIDHLGLVTEPGAALDDLLALAELPHVTVKVSALLDLATQSSTESIRQVAGAAIAEFGHDRILFGTDWPYAREFGDWHDNVAALAAALGPHDRVDDVLAACGVNARRLYWGEA